MICEDCGAELLKGEVQNEDLTWLVCWFCDCKHGDPNIRLHVHSQRSWLAEALPDAAAALEELENQQ